MNWLKLHHDLRTDRKVATLRDDEFRTFINLLILSSEQEENRGEILGLEPDLLALEVCNGDEELLARTLDRLQRLRIVSVGNAHIKEGNALVTPHVAFLHFATRQQIKPSDRPERVRERVARHREAKEGAGNAPHQIGNAPAVARNAPVTPRNAHRADTERDTDTSSPTGKRAPGADAPSAPTTRAVQEANVLLHKRCDQTERAAINAAVPDGDEAALATWTACLTEWRLRYPNNRGLSGPLDWYGVGGPPEKPQHQQRQNGQRSRTEGGAPRSASSRIDAVFERAMSNGHPGAGADPAGRRGDAAVGHQEAGRGVPRQLPG